MNKIVKALVFAAGAVVGGAVVKLSQDERIIDSVDSVLANAQMCFDDYRKVFKDRGCDFKDCCKDDDCKFGDVQACTSEHDVINRIRQLKDVTKCTLKNTREEIKEIYSGARKDDAETDEISMDDYLDSSDEFEDISTEEETAIEESDEYDESNIPDASKSDIFEDDAQSIEDTNKEEDTDKE